jgi:hypothetical protein
MLILEMAILLSGKIKPINFCDFYKSGCAQFMFMNKVILKTFLMNNVAEKINVPETIFSLITPFFFIRVSCL